MTSPDETPDWSLSLARRIPIFADWGVVRTEYAFQQATFTPRNTAIAVPDSRDRPYAGWLNASSGLIGETGSLLDQLSLSLGMVGPASFGHEAQKLVHEIRGIDSRKAGVAVAQRTHRATPLSAQLARSSRLRVQFRYGLAFTPPAGFALGNDYTFANAGVTFRIGKDLQQDFGPPRIGPSVPGSSYFVPRSNFGWYVFAGWKDAPLRGTCSSTGTLLWTAAA